MDRGRFQLPGKFRKELFEVSSHALIRQGIEYLKDDKK